MIDSRLGFQMYIKHQLEIMVEDGVVDLDKSQILEVIMEIEDDPDFHERVNEILEDVIDELESEGGW